MLSRRAKPPPQQGRPTPLERPPGPRCCCPRGRQAAAPAVRHGLLHQGLSPTEPSALYQPLTAAVPHAGAALDGTVGGGARPAAGHAAAVLQGRPGASGAAAPGLAGRDPLLYQQQEELQQLLSADCVHLGAGRQAGRGSAGGGWPSLAATSTLGAMPSDSSCHYYRLHDFAAAGLEEDSAPSPTPLHPPGRPPP
jgi:hypothetical protein